jgi:hypothetical protein
MTEIERIDDQLKRSMEGDAWHGPAILELLHGVTCQQALKKVSPNVHSIWEIVHHLIRTQEVVRERLGGKHEVLSDEEFWPPVLEATEQDWMKTVDRLAVTYHEVRAALANLTDERLDHPVANGWASLYRTINGNVQHNLYHGGQIAILKKMA